MLALYARLALSWSLCELCEVVGGADHCPFGAHFFYAPQQELPEAPCLFDLSEHGFHNLLPEPVGCFEAAIGDFLSHRLRQRPAGLAVPGRGVFGATRGDVAVDAPEFETREIGLAQLAAIG